MGEVVQEHITCHKNVGYLIFCFVHPFLSPRYDKGLISGKWLKFYAVPPS